MYCIYVFITICNVIKAFSKTHNTSNQHHHNGFDVAAIKTAIAESLNVIFNDANKPFSINDIENCIKDLRKKIHAVSSKKKIATGLPCEKSTKKT